MVSYEKRQNLPSESLSQEAGDAVDFQDDMFEEFEATDTNDDFIDDESHDLEPILSM